MPTNHKVYLGDSVFADIDGAHIVLTTEDGSGTTNTIYLEFAVVNVLIAYCKSIGFPTYSPVNKEQSP